MHVGMIIEMAAGNLADRIAVGSLDSGITFGELGTRARRAGTILASDPGANVVLIDENSLAVPLALFGAAIAGKPFVPVNYRLADDRLRAIVAQTVPATVIVGAGVADRIAGIDGLRIVDRADFLTATEDVAVDETDGWGCDPDAAAVLLFTSGTTGDPKAAVLRHRNLAAYLVSSLEFGSAPEDQAAVVCVPPYHIAACQFRPLVHLHGASGRAVGGVRSAALGRDGAGRIGHPRHGGAHDARPDPRRRRGGRWGTAVACDPSPTAVVRCRCRWSNGRWRCSTVSTW